MSRAKNKVNLGLPTGWQLISDNYYFQVPPGMKSAWDDRDWFFLGKSLPEAFRVWAKRMEVSVSVKTVADLLDRYSLEVIPQKAIRTQESNAFAMVRLKPILGAIPILQLTPQLVREYFDKREHKIAARREIEVLSHAYTKAVEWGHIDRHPFKWELRLPREESRKRDVQDWEVFELLSLTPRRRAGGVLAIQSYIRLQLLTGLRRADLLRLKVSSLGETGIHVEDVQTGKHVTYQWTDELRAAFQLARDARPVKASPWLFCKGDGTGYIDEQTGHADGWDSMWGRFVDRALAETKIVERFTEHDLRAKCVRENPTVELAKTVLARLRVSTRRDSDSFTNV